MADLGHDERLHPQVSESWLRVATDEVKASSGIGERYRASRRAVSPVMVNATSARAPTTAPTSAAARAMAPTSGTGAFSSIGYVLMLATAIASAGLLLGDLRSRLRAPPAALVLTAAVAVPSLIEFGWHGIYTALSRQPDQIRAHHQWWRLLTGAIVQDGGVEGTIFNLVVLFLIATLAACLWGPRWTIGLFVFGVIVFNLMASYALPSPGGGNSGATFSWPRRW